MRRDDSLVEQTLFAGLTAERGVRARPATGKVGVVTPADFAAVTSARRAFADARNNTAAESAAERVRAALASAKRWNYTAPVRAWTHLAFVAVPANASAYDSGGGSGGSASTTRTNDVVVRLYVDGAFHSSVALESEMPMPLGAVGGPGRAAFAIDEVRFWTRALAPWEVWGTRGKFLNGDEAGLLAYLPLEEGCGASARDVAAANDAVRWNLTARNATWEWQRRAFACATLRAVSPTVAPAAAASRSRCSARGLRVSRTTRARGGNVSVCRFGYRGGAGAGAVETPATVVSDGIVTCAAPPAIRDENRGRGGAVSVQFCDPGMSCCSEPESAAFAGPPPDFHSNAAADASLPTNASLPASFLAPPRGKRVGSGEYPQILYREARVAARAETRGREPRRDRLRPRVGVRGAGPRREPPRVGADVRIHRRRRIRRPRLSRTALLGLVPGKPLRNRKKIGNARARVGDGARRLRRGGDVRTPAASLGVGVERLSRFGRRARRAPPRRRRRRRGPGGDRRLRDGHARLAPDGPRVRQSVFFIFGRDFFGVLIGVRGVLIGGVLGF